MRSKINLPFVLSIFLAILAIAPVVRGQSTTDGAIGGTVTDQSGAVVPEAVVKSRNLGTAVTSSGMTDGSGRYLLIHLQPGTYSLEISASGFSTFLAGKIVVEVGRATTIDATLGVKGTTETVMATAELPVITSDRAACSGERKAIAHTSTITPWARSTKRLQTRRIPARGVAQARPAKTPRSRAVSGFASGGANPVICPMKRYPRPASVSM